MRPAWRVILSARKRPASNCSPSGSNCRRNWKEKRSGCVPLPANDLMHRAQAAHSMTPLTVNGTEFAVTRRGRGERVVLVHGAVGDFRTWDNQLPRLAANLEVIA